MLKVTLHSLANAGVKQTAYVKQAVALMAEVVNCTKFRALVNEAKFTYISNVDRNRANKNAILQCLVEGRELGSAPDNEINLRINLRNFYYGFRPFRVLNKTTVGATDPGGPVIDTNYYHINYWIQTGDLASGVGHWLHEWMHVAGYTHEHTSGDAGDVAYKVGSIAENIAWEMQGSRRVLTPVILRKAHAEFRRW